MFETAGTSNNYRAIKCINQGEMVKIRLRLTVYGEENIGLLIGKGACNLKKLSELASTESSAHLPKLHLRKSSDSTIEISYKKDAPIDKQKLIEALCVEGTKPHWAVTKQYFIERILH